MSYIKTTTYKLPACFVVALMNDDYSGLQDAEIKELDAWVERTHTALKSALFYAVDSSEPYECEFNDFSIRYCTVCDITFQLSA